MNQAGAVKPHAFIGWRLLALFYDVFPALGLWFAVGAIALALHQNQPVRGDSMAGWLELLVLWTVTGAYAVISWRRGGQTLGMRPWCLRVTTQDGAAASVPALIRRYAVGTVSLLLAGLGFWWAWIDHKGLTWHDRASDTRMRREPR